MALGERKELDPVALGRAFALPPSCLEVLASLGAAGHGAWLCGGTARDLLAGVVPLDLDVCTTARPSDVRRVLPESWLRSEQPGEPYGTLQVAARTASIEVTTLRGESDYEDRRKPGRVWFTTEPSEDHVRRDFTVNALYVDPFRAELLDFADGVQDLADARLRCVGDPFRRLFEDSLRVLRALRLCSEHGWVPDAATWNGIRASASGVASLSGHRVLEELGKLLRSRGRARGLKLLVDSGVAAVLLPDLLPLAATPQPAEFHPEGDVLRHTALLLANLKEPVEARLAWAAVFHDFGKPATYTVAPDRIRFDGHDVLGAEMARAWLEARGAGSSLAGDVAEIVRQHIRIASVPGFRPAKRNRFLSDRLFPAHLEFHRADCLACHRKLDVHAELTRMHAELPPDLPAPLLRGRDLLELGVSPGPRLGELLGLVEDARFAGEIVTTEDALALVRKLIDAP